MGYKYIFICFFVFVINESVTKDTGSIIIHATTNSSVPSIDYIADAVELLKSAYEIYPEDLNRAEAFLELYQNKYNTDDWNVVTCYKSILLKASYYVELQVTSSGKDVEKSKKDKSDSKSDCLIMLFATKKVEMVTDNYQTVDNDKDD